MVELSICLPYYMSSAMLAVHYQGWAAWPEALKQRVEIVVVDDGSPTSPAADVPRPTGLPALSVYRVLVDQPWHQDGARNLGAYAASGRWLLLTDMDHVLPAESAARLLAHIDSGIIREGAIYTLGRIDVDTGRRSTDPLGSPKPHPNSFALSRATYWFIGGYDEDLCGLYGTDSAFRWRAFGKARHGHLGDVSLLRYTNQQVADAETTTMARKDGRDRASRDRLVAEKRALGLDQVVPVLTFAWEQIV